MAAVIATVLSIVEHVSLLTIYVADRHRIVCHPASGENLAVAFLRLFRLSEVVGVVGADELIAWYDSDGGRGFVNVGNFAVGADGDERIEGSFDQASCILGGQFLGGDVANRA